MTVLFYSEGENLNRLIREEHAHDSAYGISSGCFQRGFAVIHPLFATPWTIAHQASLSITNPQSLPKLMSIELVMPSNHLILCCPLLLLPSIFPSIRVFSKLSSVLCIRWPKYWSFSFSISPSNEYSGLISFKMDWFDLLAVQGTLSRVFSNTTVQKHQSSVFSFLCGPTLISVHDC